MLVHAYSDDSDDRVLAEIQPKYIVMFEPNQDFVRRIEVGNNASCSIVLTLHAPLGVSKFESRAWGQGLLHGLSTQLRRA